MQSWLKHGLLFCFHSTWKKNKTGLMKNTHGKCFIISSSSPTEIWHHSVFRKNFSRPPSLAVWLYKADTLSFPVRSFQRNLLLFPPSLIPSSWPQPWLRAPAAMLCLLNRMERWAARLKILGQHAHTHIASKLAKISVPTQETDSDSFVKKICRGQCQTLGRVFVGYRKVYTDCFH